MVSLETAKSASVAVDSDIIKMLDEISIGSGREYEMDYDADKRDAIKSVLKAIKKVTGKTAKDLIIEMIDPAEEFYRELLHFVPKNCILQHRIGLDYTTKAPATLTVISHKYESDMPQIMQMAAELEINIFKKNGYFCAFWVITDHKLDQHLINHDFPCHKVNI